MLTEFLNMMGFGRVVSNDIFLVCLNSLQNEGRATMDIHIPLKY
jgi:hypothetical protein